MSSLITGFEYDIFISYRQKDNKYDGWVTEFVNNLKKELEATFKEEISLYFDINPHDGLLETHNVDASLKEKLNCLIFIPVISQTYCDSKSFAWQYEFCAFNRTAMDDTFGRDIRLTGGNVASRILPVKIHELDAKDQKIFEKETGGVLRAIEFIYREPGVNRPLKPDDDTNENLNKTKYRNQVNKVANAVKEIINSLEKANPEDRIISGELNNGKPESSKKIKPKIVAGSFLVIILILLGYFVIPRLYNPSTQIEKSIAVLPFTDMSPEKDQEYLGDGLADDIISALSGIEGLKVISRTSSFQFKGIGLDLREAGRKLDVAVILEGSVQKSGNRIRITIQLINTEDGSHIWSEKWDREMNDIFDIQDEISSGITEKLKITLLEGVQGNSRKTNPDAYMAFQQGKYYLNNYFLTSAFKAKAYFEKAIELDPDYVDAYAWLSFTFYSLRNYIYPAVDTLNKMMALDSGRMYALKAITMDDKNSLAHIAISNGYLNSYDYDKVEKEYRKALELNPGEEEKSTLAAFLSNHGQFDEAEKLALEAIKIDPLTLGRTIFYSNILLSARKYDQALVQINKVLDIDPNNFEAYNILGYYYFYTNDKGKAKLAWAKLQDLFGDSTLAAIFRKSDFESALKSWIERSFTPDSPFSSDHITRASVYAMLGDRENTLKYLQLAIRNHSYNVASIKVCQEYDFVRDDPRFIEIYEKAGLKAYDESRKYQNSGN